MPPDMGGQIRRSRSCDCFTFDSTAVIASFPSQNSCALTKGSGFRKSAPPPLGPAHQSASEAYVGHNCSRILICTKTSFSLLMSLENFMTSSAAHSSIKFTPETLLKISSIYHLYASVQGRHYLGSGRRLAA
jgi:hypothetical protein